MPSSVEESHWPGEALDTTLFLKQALTTALIQPGDPKRWLDTFGRPCDTLGSDEIRSALGRDSPPSEWKVDAHQRGLIPPETFTTIRCFRSAASVKNHYTSTLTRKMRLGLINDMVEKSRGMTFDEACSLLSSHQEDTDAEMDIRKDCQVYLIDLFFLLNFIIHSLNWSIHWQATFKVASDVKKSEISPIIYQVPLPCYETLVNTVYATECPLSTFFNYWWADGTNLISLLHQSLKGFKKWWCIFQDKAFVCLESVISTAYMVGWASLGNISLHVRGGECDECFETFRCEHRVVRVKVCFLKLLCIKWCCCTNETDDWL